MCDPRKCGARMCGAPENVERECVGPQKTRGSTKRFYNEGVRLINLAGRNIQELALPMMLNVSFLFTITNLA